MTMKIGHHYSRDGRCEFVVWAPFLDQIELKIISPYEKLISLEKDAAGYWGTVTNDMPQGADYLFRLNYGTERPDPSSHFQPQGVHGPSQIVDHNAFIWEDRDWQGIPLTEMIIYELHIGTFTEKGVFASVIPRLDGLKEIGLNAVDIMPVAQFPGERNWGYDGVYPFSVQNSYGGPDGLKYLVNECHKRGIAVILDVVYNHLGPEGNYLWDYGPYFTDRYNTPWGMAVNYDDAYSNDVRNYFIENALHWFTHYHIDGLRLDAIHAMYDMSARPFLLELAEKTEEYSREKGRKFYLLPESDLNDAKVIRPRQYNGYGHDAQWSDDLHHAVHTLLTGEKTGYYGDFGRIEHLAKALREGFVYSGQYSEYRKRNHGNSSAGSPGFQFIVCSQNHDQVGNRMLGERLSSLVSFEALKLAAGTVILSPFIPLFFMGEEYGEDNPFLYFVSHSDPDLIEGVRSGRKEEFRGFAWKGEPPDPQSVETFLRSKIEWDKRNKGSHKALLEYYKALIRLRREIPALSHLYKDNLDVFAYEEDKILVMNRWKDETSIVAIFNFNSSAVRYTHHFPEGEWNKLLDSSDTTWKGPGSLLPEHIHKKGELTIHGQSVAVYSQEREA